MGWLQSLFGTSDPKEDLPLSARVSQLESDLLNVHAQADAMHSGLRKLQGKVYRGVSLGETVDANPEPPTEAEAPESVPANVFEKASLYKAAAQLRGR